MRKIGTFFGGVLVVDGVAIILMASSDPSMASGAGLGWAMLIGGALLALASLGKIVKYPDQSWISWAFSLLGGILFSAFYAIGIVMAVFFAFLPGGSTPRGTVKKFGAKQFEQKPRPQVHHDKSGRVVGRTLEDGKQYDANGDLIGQTSEA